MQDRVTIGMVQWHAVPGDPAANLETAVALVAEAARQGADLVVLPELWASGYDASRLGEIVAAAAEPVPGPRSDRLAEAARTHGIWLAAGTVPELADGATYNTAVVYGPTGEIVALHRKAHLYRATAEDAVFAAGREATVFDTEPFGRVGLAICFDGDQPGYARRLRDRGARVVVMPAAYEAGAETWWDLLHPANALANGQWWITVNQAGGEGDAAMFGRSRVIAPDGAVVCEAPRHDAGGPAVLTCTIDLAAGIADADLHGGVIWTDARPEIY